MITENDLTSKNKTLKTFKLEKNSDEKNFYKKETDGIPIPVRADYFYFFDD